jgi:integrase
VIALLGTGIRFGELGGLRRNRVRLDATPPAVQVVTVRYQAGRFGSGFKSRPKSTAGIREIPLASQVVDAIRRQIASGSTPSDLVFCDPVAGSVGGDRPPLSRYLFRHVYHIAVARLTDPARELPPSERRVLAALRTDGPQSLAQLAERFSRPGGKLRPATIRAALDVLEAAGLVHAARGESTACWTAVSAAQASRFNHLDLHGPHDLRHTFATWLEDAGIPSRVIDELMGHENSRARQDGASRIGLRYRDTTPEMFSRAVAAIEARLFMVLAIAGEASEQARPELGAQLPDSANRRQ